jgi:hypothetical protein
MPACARPWAVANWERSQHHWAPACRIHLNLAPLFLFERLKYHHSVLSSRLTLLTLLEFQAHIEMNNNICTVQSEPSTFASLSFDPGGPKKHLTTAPSCRLERHLTVFCIDPIVVYFVNIDVINKKARSFGLMQISIRWRFDQFW